jgi:hypothetical protein
MSWSMRRKHSEEDGEIKDESGEEGEEEGEITPVTTKPILFSPATRLLPSNNSNTSRNNINAMGGGAIPMVLPLHPLHHLLLPVRVRAWRLIFVGGNNSTPTSALGAAVLSPQPPILPRHGSSSSGQATQATTLHNKSSSTVARKTISRDSGAFLSSFEGDRAGVERASTSI